MVFHALGYLFFLVGTIQGRSVKQDDPREPFELNDYLYGTYSTRSFNGSWLTGDSFYYRSPTDNNYFTYDLNTKDTSLFLNISVLAGYGGGSFTVSPDQLYILIRYSVSSVFRHSTTALYTIHDIANGDYYDIAENEPVQIAQWSPSGHGLVYVYKNNIYYHEHPSAKPKVVTKNGNETYYYNGVPDWVYEEEVLGSGSAFWFSPNGKQIAFASFDDTDVEEFFYFMYGRAGDLNDDDFEFQYPQEVRIKYPKVNRTNPTVKAFIANLETEDDTAKVIEIEAVPERFSPNDYVLYGMTWISDDDVAILYTNRIQNEGELVRCNRDGICQQETTYKEDRGWLDISLPRYGKDGTQRLEILPQLEDDDYFYHLVLTEVETGTPRRLTAGRFVVTSIYGWDQINDLIYFAGSRENKPSQQQVYVVNTKTKEMKCLTCDMETPDGLCLYGGASFSKDLSRYVKVCQGPGPYLVEIHNTKDESDVIVWEDNQALRDRLALKLLPVKEDLRVPVDGGFTANVRLLLPPGLDKNGEKKYPAVVYVYAGPNSNQISDAYSAGFQNYIVTNREYIYILIDGRGSGKDGQNKMFQIYKRLATVEIEDQISVTKYLQEKYPFIDADNTGIWGWSYGGFATVWALVQDTENVFKFGLSVAPVTDFALYDSIYTERYMGLPTEDDNDLGYNNTDVTRRVEALRGKRFFLIHGNADDNVHYQQAMLLAKALELADIQFMQQSYPDENHSLGHVSAHLYHTIDRFWARSVGLPDPPLIRFRQEEVVDVESL